MTEEFIQVADITDIDINQSQSVNIDEVDILICNTDNGVFAVEDKCSHADIPLCGGQITGNYITCPVHGAVFDLTDGSVQSPPAFEDLNTFEVKIEGTSISVKRPHKR
jgi:3-phenylpropionate/trans-cinnamate dioxygenase ferredoxin subunit|tara:strand:- start:46 stop:369 length:324 start_codon:yes stop_codon:yes gene_type:complete